MSEQVRTAIMGWLLKSCVGAGASLGAYADLEAAIEAEVSNREARITELSDEKTALLLVVDDCHRIMDERADHIEELEEAVRDAAKADELLHSPEFEGWRNRPAVKRAVGEEPGE